MERRHDEFSLTIRWRSPNSGSYPRPTAPGFYLTAGWANEGEAEYPVKDARLTFEQLHLIAANITEVLGAFDELDRAIPRMKDRYEKQRLDQIATLERQQVNITEQLAILKGEA